MSQVLNLNIMYPSQSIKNPVNQESGSSSEILSFTTLPASLWARNAAAELKFPIFPSPVIQCPQLFLVVGCHTKMTDCLNIFLGQISCSFLKTFFNKNNFVVLVLLKELNVKIYLTEYINTEIRKFEIRNRVKTNQRYLQGS